jgi:hypothetical protein
MSIIYPVPKENTIPLDKVQGVREKKSSLNAFGAMVIFHGNSKLLRRKPNAY